MGTYLAADVHGFLPARPPGGAMVEPWSTAVRVLVGGYLDEWGSAVHSVYVRGSVARNLAVPGLSDLDSFCVLRPEAGTGRTGLAGWSAAINRELHGQFPFLSGVEVDLLPVESVLDRRNFYSFVLKCEAVCLHGEDLSGLLEPFHLSEVNYQTRYFREHMDEFLTEWPREPEEDRPGFIAWLAKRMLRLGMELVMEREKRYTRDLYLCYESFATHHPEQEAAMYRVLELAMNPVTDDETVMLLREFGGWLAGLGQASLEEPDQLRQHAAQ